MKKITIFWMAVVAFMAGIAMVACSNDDSLNVDAEPEFYTVQLGWDGEIIDVMYEPMGTRATTDDLYGIQVYSTPDVELAEGASAVWSYYAYGLFDDPDNISINLLKGYKYKFVATMVKDGKNVVTPNGSGYYRPFTTGQTASTTTHVAALNNQFDYQANIYFTSLGKGATMIKGTSSIYHRPNVDRFYGELVDYTPGEQNAKAKIQMKRVGFGAKFIAKGKLAKSGTLHVQMEGAPAIELALTNSDNQTSDTYTFSNVAAAWADNKYTETIDVTINWTREDGTTLPLGTHQVTYKRNATTVVNVNIENDGEDSGLGFDIAESETGVPVEDGENDVTITDGEIVETEVDTNK